MSGPAKITTAKPARLKPHPSLKPLHQWEDDDAGMVALVDDIRENGILEPIKIVSPDLIIDGRHRWRAAKRLKLEQVPVIEVTKESAQSIIISAIVHRRHYSKGALAYLVFPVLEPALVASRKRSLANLKRGDQHSPAPSALSGMTLEDYADQIGIARRYMAYASKLHKAFAKDKTLRAEWEPKIISGEVGLGAACAGIAGQEATKDKPKAKGNAAKQFGLFTEAFAQTTHRFKYWGKFGEEEKTQANKALRSFADKMPADLRKALVKTLRAADAAEAEAAKGGQA